MEAGGFTNNFDKLFNKYVPHIVEKIFFNLDYDSLLACCEVSKAWKELLSSERYRKRAVEAFEEKKNNERRLWESSRSGNVMEVRHLLSLGVDPNCEHFDETSPMGGRY